MEYSSYLIILGIVMMIAEVFLPSGIIGSVGLVCFFMGTLYLTGSLVTTIGIFIMALIIFIILFIILIKRMPDTNRYKTLFLKTKLGTEEGVLSSKENCQHMGEIMEVYTFLRPSGKVIRDGIKYDAMSEGSFIEKGSKVKVVGNKGYILIVRKVDCQL